MINKTILLGRVGKAAEVRHLENGSKAARFSLATDEGYYDQNKQWVDRTEWHSLIAWRQLADKAEKLSPGDLIYAEGKLQTRTWEKEGHKFQRTEVILNYFRIVQKKDQGQQQGYSAMPAPPPSTRAQHLTGNAGQLLQQEVIEPAGGEDDDLPF